ncbi:MAG: helix-turn-helix transcriptional regulator [Opitutales bacterium]|nr:helix-turn-helix transcriptional regulator [Opitutales bacterium]
MISSREYDYSSVSSNTDGRIASASKKDTGPFAISSLENSFKQGELTLFGPSEYVRVCVIFKGELNFSFADKSKASLCAGSWFLLYNGEQEIVADASPDFGGISMDCSASALRKLRDAVCACRACKALFSGRSFFFQSGDASGRIDELARLLNGRDGQDLASLFMRNAYASELIARVLQRPEIIQHGCCQGSFCKRHDMCKINAVARYLEENLGDEHSLGELSRRHYINEFKLKSGFREHFGETVFGYLRRKRMERAHTLLSQGRTSVMEVASMLGYSNPSHFARAFRQVYGCNPGQLIKNA